MLSVREESTRESLAIRVRQRLPTTGPIEVLTHLVLLRGILTYIRSDNGPEFVGEAVRHWVDGVGACMAFIEWGSPRGTAALRGFSER